MLRNHLMVGSLQPSNQLQLPQPLRRSSYIQGTLGKGYRKRRHAAQCGEREITSLPALESAEKLVSAFNCLGWLTDGGFEARRSCIS